MSRGAIMDPLDPSSASNRPTLELGSVTADSAFLKVVSSEQRQIYGEQLRNHDLHIGKASESNPNRWVFFSPLHHARNGLLSADLIMSARKGAEILIIGAGCGDIERYLIKARSVDPNRITAADIDLSLYPNDLGVRTFEFDMFHSWPVEAKQYQYILIPEALGMALLRNKAINRHQPDFDLLEEMIEIQEQIYSDGLESVSKFDIEQYLGWAYRPGSRAALAWSVIEQALRYLAPGGELRINGHNLNDEEIIPILVFANRGDTPVSRVTFGNNSILLQRES
jgi:hypothetical protein